MSDEEVVDPKATLEVSCKPKCVRQLKEYQMGIAVESSFSLRIRDILVISAFKWNTMACTKRIEGDEWHKHCTGQYFDYWHCIDKCVAAKLFDHLK